MVIFTVGKIKGIGKKTAERLVLELRDKLAKQPFESKYFPFETQYIASRCVKCSDALGIARCRRTGNTKGHTIRPSLTSLEDVIKKALKTL